MDYEEIKKDPQRITKIKPFKNKYNWEGIKYPSKKDDWKKFEKNILYIFSNVLYPAYVSKHNLNREKQVTIFNGEKGHVTKSKRRRQCIILPAIGIIKRNSLVIFKKHQGKASWSFLLSELLLFLRKKKQTSIA